MAGLGVHGALPPGVSGGIGKPAGHRRKIQILSLRVFPELLGRPRRARSSGDKVWGDKDRRAPAFAMDIDNRSLHGRRSAGPTLAASGVAAARRCGTTASPSWRSRWRSPANRLRRSLLARPRVLPVLRSGDPDRLGIRRLGSGTFRHRSRPVCVGFLRQRIFARWSPRTASTPPSSPWSASARRGAANCCAARAAPRRRARNRRSRARPICNRSSTPFPTP